MKNTKFVFCLSIAAGILSGLGAHRLADRIDPTSRVESRVSVAGPTAEACTLPCVACDYDEA